MENECHFTIFNLLLVFLLSLTFLGIYDYYSVFQKQVTKRYDIFIVYFIFALVVALFLLALNKLPIIDEPIIALKSLILIAMPTSMGAIVVDSINKE